MSSIILFAIPFWEAIPKRKEKTVLLVELAFTITISPIAGWYAPLVTYMAVLFIWVGMAYLHENPKS